MIKSKVGENCGLRIYVTNMISSNTTSNIIFDTVCTQMDSSLPWFCDITKDMFGGLTERFSCTRTNDFEQNARDLMCAYRS